MILYILYIRYYTRRNMNPYNHAILDLKLHVDIKEVGKGLKDNIKSKICNMVENRCIEHGIVKVSSIRIISHSAGNVNGDKILFHVVFEAMVCSPVEGEILQATVKTLTKAGIHAIVEDEEEGTSPITVFVARDHHQGDKYFKDVAEGSTITVRVIGARFELNDPYICVIAHLEKPEENKQT